MRSGIPGAHRGFEDQMDSIAVVVVNYNTCAQLRDCLASIPSGTEVVVVDNNSNDASVDMVRREFPEVTLLANTQNQGYGAGANQGIRACGADYVLVLNSDTLLDSDSLRELALHLDGHAGVGLAAPRLMNPDGTPQLSCFPFPGTFRWLIENEPIAPLLGRVPSIRKHLLCHTPPLQAASVPWVLGAAIAVRRAVFEQVGGFDESFFMYFEEVDLCRRLRRDGWDIHYVPAARVTHLGAASTSQVRGEMAVEHFRSTLRFYRRYLGGVRLAFWISVMRAKMLFRLMRDSAAIPLARRPDERRRLREEVTAWRRTFRVTARDVGR